MITPDSHEFRRQLRMELRQRRRQLSALQQHHAAQQVYHRLIHHLWFLRARRIAFYLPNEGELDPLPLLAAALNMGKQCFLPVLSRHRRQHVSFAPFQEGDPLVANHWGILEPRVAVDAFIPAQTLDLVLMPLVGFDDRGARLGMGKGFYDRTFAFRRRRGSSRPRLVGLAHECQRVDRLTVAPWDVSLDAVVSDHRWYSGQ